MTSSFLKQRFGEPVHVSHSSAAESRFQQAVVESCLIDTCISSCLAPVFLPLDDAQLAPVCWADTSQGCCTLHLSHLLCMQRCLSVS